MRKEKKKKPTNPLGYMKINIIKRYCQHKRHYGLPWNSTNTLKMYLDAFKHAYYFTEERNGFLGAIRF